MKHKIKKHINKFLDTHPEQLARHDKKVGAALLGVACVLIIVALLSQTFFAFMPFVYKADKESVAVEQGKVLGASTEDASYQDFDAVRKAIPNMLEFDGYDEYQIRRDELAAVEAFGTRNADRIMQETFEGANMTGLGAFLTSAPEMLDVIFGNVRNYCLGEPKQTKIIKVMDDGAPLIPYLDNPENYNYEDKSLAVTHFDESTATVYFELRSTEEENQPTDYAIMLVDESSSDDLESYNLESVYYKIEGDLSDKTIQNGDAPMPGVQVLDFAEEDEYEEYYGEEYETSFIDDELLDIDMPDTNEYGFEVPDIPKIPSNPVDDLSSQLGSMIGGSSLLSGEEPMSQYQPRATERGISIKHLLPESNEDMLFPEKISLYIIPAASTIEVLQTKEELISEEASNALIRIPLLPYKKQFYTPTVNGDTSGKSYVDHLREELEIDPFDWQRILQGSDAFFITRLINDFEAGIMEEDLDTPGRVRRFVNAKSHQCIEFQKKQVNNMLEDVAKFTAALAIAQANKMLIQDSKDAVHPSDNSLLDDPVAGVAVTIPIKTIITAAIGEGIAGFAKDCALYAASKALKKQAGIDLPAPVECKFIPENPLPDATQYLELLKGDSFMNGLKFGATMLPDPKEFIKEELPKQFIKQIDFKGDTTKAYVDKLAVIIGLKNILIPHVIEPLLDQILSQGPENIDISLKDILNSDAFNKLKDQKDKELEDAIENEQEATKIQARIEAIRNQLLGMEEEHLAYLYDRIMYEYGVPSEFVHDQIKNTGAIVSAPSNPITFFIEDYTVDPSNPYAPIAKLIPEQYLNDSLISLDFLKQKDEEEEDGMMELSESKFYDDLSDRVHSYRLEQALNEIEIVKTFLEASVVDPNVEVSADGKAAFEVVLNLRPESSVSLDVLESNIARSTLTFVPDGWDTPQEAILEDIILPAGSTDTFLLDVLLNSDEIFTYYTFRSNLETLMLTAAPIPEEEESEENEEDGEGGNGSGSSDGGGIDEGSGSSDNGGNNSSGTSSSSSSVRDIDGENGNNSSGNSNGINTDSGSGNGGNGTSDGQDTSTNSSGSNGINTGSGNGSNGDGSNSDGSSNGSGTNSGNNNGDGSGGSDESGDDDGTTPREILRNFFDWVVPQAYAQNVVKAFTNWVFPEKDLASIQNPIVKAIATTLETTLAEDKFFIDSQKQHKVPPYLNDMAAWPAEDVIGEFESFLEIPYEDLTEEDKLALEIVFKIALEAYDPAIIIDPFE